MAFINLVQGLIFNTGSKNTTVSRSEQLQLGYTKGWSGTKSSCDGRCDSRSTRDCSTSTHDLISYVWSTEGEGIGDSFESTAQGDADESEDENGVPKLCPTCPFGRLKQCCRGGIIDSGLIESLPVEAEERKSVRDTGTSTFDLSAYYWGTMGSEDSVEDEDMIDANAGLYDFVTEAGYFGETGRHLAGRKRSRAVIDYGLDFSKRPVEVARPVELAPPVKKQKRRTARC